MEKGFTIPLWDHGYVRYIRHLGTDQSIVEGARISYGKPSKGEEADKKLIRYLYKNRHTSPFEHVNITFNIKIPIFIMRQFVRHRTFKLNELSARYTELPREFYIPDTYRSQSKINKQSSDASDELDHLHIQKMVTQQCQQAYAVYQGMLVNGVAREMARMVLPVNLYTEIYVNCDLHNLMHFLRLRCDGHAQSEMQELAQAMKTITEELYPWSMDAYNKTKVTVTQED